MKTQKLTLVFACVFFLFTKGLAQQSFSSPKLPSASGTGTNIDVVYQRCNWRINPDSSVKAIGGSVLMRFTTLVANVNKISFDLSSALTISKIVFRSANLPAANIVRSGNVVTVTLSATLPNNYTDEIDIFYNGTPPAFSTYGEGYEKATIAGGNAIYTLAESYGDDGWWPCKADMQDKIEAMDIIISMPSAFRAATNGVLVSDVVSGAQRIMTYKHAYPIASYLVAVGVAKYTVFDRGTVSINGTNVPIVYYVYSGRNATTSTAEIKAMDFCKQELIAFSEKFGDYPFKNEKYGMYEFGWGGGMEHQTFSAMSWGSMGSWSTIAHELAHQWFGDKVTFATWNHLWLAEGFAKYNEALAAELVPSLGQNAKSHRSSIKSTALSTSTTPVYLSAASIANSNTIWTTANDNAIYQRGAMVVSMLRKLAGDTRFFKALKNYLADPALMYHSATTDDLKNHFEAVLNYDLDAFFTDYINGQGNPAYDVSWGSTGNSINIELTTQRRSGTSVAYFHTPVVLRIYNAGKTKDTTVVIYDQNGQLSYAGNGISAPNPGRILGYNLSFAPASVEVDPDYETMVRGQDGVAAATNRVAQSTVTKSPGLNYVPMIVLPISIIDFNGNKRTDGNYLSLQLTTTSENINVIAERSENGINFSAMGSMIKNGSSQSSALYTYQDKAFHTSKAYYYRARAIDEKSVVKYSKVIMLAGEDEVAVIKLMPNPAYDHLTVLLPKSKESENVLLTIFNSAGAVVERKSLINAVNGVRLNIGHLPAGSYTLSLKDEQSGRWTKPFAVVR